MRTMQWAWGIGAAAGQGHILPPMLQNMATPSHSVKGKVQTRLAVSPTDQSQKSEKIKHRNSKDKFSKKDLMCSVCLETLKEPKLLPCCHTYCKGCLQGILRKSKENSSIKCPQCRSINAIPSGGVDEFPSDMVSANALNFHALKDKEKIKQSIPCSMCTEDDPVTTHCPTCSKFLCEFCSKAHKRQVDYRDHKTLSLDDLDSETLKGFERPRRCSRHSGELLKLYCKTCRQLICRDCTLVDHHDHAFGFSKDVRPDIQKQVESSVEMLSAKQKELETQLKFMNDTETSRNNHSKSLQREINSAYDSYIAALESHRKKLLEQEKEAKDRDLKQIWAQKEFIEMKLAGIDGSMHYAKRLCSCPSDLDMLEMSGEATQQLSNLSEVRWNPTSQLELPVPLVFSSNRELGSINPVPLKRFSISISRVDSTSVQSTSQKPLYRLRHGHHECELGKAVQLVVQLHSDPPTSISSSLIIPSISVTTRSSSPANYVVTHQGDGSWMIRVSPLHSGEYYVTASLQKRSAQRDIDVYSKTISESYRFSVEGAPKIGARVRRGPDWPQENNEDGGIGNRGTVIHLTQQQGNEVNVHVQWDNGNKKAYQLGYQWNYNSPIELVPY